MQFKITGIPESWTPEKIIWVPDPGMALMLGHPLFPHSVANGGPGIAATFSTCRPEGAPEGETGPVPIGRILVVGALTPPNVVLRVEAWPVLPNETCPIFIRCDAPDFSLACVEVGEAALNGDAAGCRAVTAVEGTTWTAVRLLYQ